MDATTYKTACLDSFTADSEAKNEDNDCTVKALAAAGHVSYNEAHAALAKHGRPHRKGPKAHGTIHAIRCPALEKAARELGIGFEILPRHSYSAKTMVTAARDPRLAKGNYICMVRGHVAAVVDGEVIDWTAGRRHQIKEVYKLTPRTEPLPKVEPKAEPMKRMTGFDQRSLF